MDTLLTQKFTRFLMQRADRFIILRRKAVPGYNISFLVTNAHLEYLVKAKLIDFIIKVPPPSRHSSRLSTLLASPAERRLCRHSSWRTWTRRSAT